MFQPLTIALTALFFAALFFVMTMMDMRRIEALVSDVLKMQASTISDSIQKTSLQKYNHLYANETHHQAFSEWHINESAFSGKESLSHALVDWLKSLEAKGLPDAFNQENLPSLQFSAIAMLDENGRVVAQSGSISSKLLVHCNDLVTGLREIDVHLFDPVDSDNPFRFIGIHRKDGKGAILLTLDETELRYWKIRIAVQQAFSDRLWGKEVAYLSIEDTGGGVLAQTGNMPQGKMEECLLMARSVREPDSPATQCMNVGDVKFLEFSVPFTMTGTPVGIIRIGLETHETDRLLMKHRRHAMFWAGLMMTIGLMAMWLLYRTQNRHIQRLQKMQDELHHAEKLSSLGKLGAEVAHEIRNPLNAVSMATQRLQREFIPEDDEKKIEFNRITHIIRNEVKRLNGIVEDFLSLSRNSRLNLRQQSIAAILDHTVFLIQEDAASKGIHIEKKWAQISPQVMIDANKIEQAFLNLIRNAMESISGSGVITIAIAPAENSMIAVSFRDTGSGISAGSEKQIFDPYFTTKEKGTGLGLSIAHEIILAHGGQIQVNTQAGRGTTFEILLPGMD